MLQREVILRHDRPKRPTGLRRLVIANTAAAAGLAFVIDYALPTLGIAPTLVVLVGFGWAALVVKRVTQP